MKRQVRDNDLILDYLQSVQRPSLLGENKWFSRERKSLIFKSALFLVITHLMAIGAKQIETTTPEAGELAASSRTPASAPLLPRTSEATIDVVTAPLSGALEGFQDFIVHDED